MSAIGLRMEYVAWSLEFSGFFAFSSLLLEAIINHSMLNAQCSVFNVFLCGFFYKFHVRFVSHLPSSSSFSLILFLVGDDVCLMLAAYLFDDDLIQYKLQFLDIHLGTVAQSVINDL